MAFGRPQTWPHCRIRPCMRIKVARRQRRARPLTARAAHAGPHRANSPGQHSSSGTQADARNQAAVSQPVPALGGTPVRQEWSATLVHVPGVAAERLVPVRVEAVPADKVPPVMRPLTPGMCTGYPRCHRRAAGRRYRARPGRKSRSPGPDPARARHAPASRCNRGRGLSRLPHSRVITRHVQCLQVAVREALFAGVRRWCRRCTAWAGSARRSWRSSTRTGSRAGMTWCGGSTPRRRG